MPDATKELQVVISARDEASSALKSIGGQISDLVEKARAGATLISAGFSLAGKSIIDLASDMEQTKVSFDTMIGNTQLASKTLAELSDFAKKTPFDLPQVLDGSKRLLAYNVAAKDLIPTFEMLGNISSGVGREKLPQLILAFGQVKAATKLTGAELRQFSESGVPLLQALVDKANEGGGVLTKVGGAAKKTKVDIGEMNDKLAIARKRLEEASKSGKTKESTMMTLKNTIQNYEQKLSAANATTGEAAAKFVRVKVTAEDMIQRISDGEVKFNDVEAALKGMTGEGGKFFNLMDKQSKTFGGTMSNIGDQMKRAALGIMGISLEAETFGEVIEGGMFSKLRDGAYKVLQIIDELAPKMTGFMASILDNGPAVAGILAGIVTVFSIALGPMVASVAAALALAAAIGTVAAGFTYLIDQVLAGNPYFQALAAAIVGVAAAILVSLIPAFAAWAVGAGAAAIATLTALAPLLAIGVAIGVLSLAVIELSKFLYETSESFRAIVQPIIDVTNQYDLLGIKAREVKTAQDELKKSNEELGTAEQTYARQLTEKNAAVLAHDKAVKDLEAAVKKYKEGSPERVQAEVNEQRARYNLEDQTKKLNIASQNVTDSTLKLQKAQDTASAVTENYTRHVEKHKSAWQSVADAIGNALGKLGEYISKSGAAEGLKAARGAMPFQHGGFVPGSYSDAVPAVLHGGERVIPRNGVDANPGLGGGGGVNINITGSFQLDSQDRVQELASTIIDMLGRQNELAAKGFGV